MNPPVGPGSELAPNGGVNNRHFEPLRRGRRIGVDNRHCEPLQRSAMEAIPGEGGLIARAKQKRALYGHNQGKDFPPRELVEMTPCLVCGKTFPRKSKMGPRPETCGDPACREERRKVRREAYGPRQSPVLVYPLTRTCEWCGEELYPKRKDARYHSGKCRVAAHRSRVK